MDTVDKAEPEATTRAVLPAAKGLKKPPDTVAELLQALRQEGAKALVHRRLNA